MTATQNEILDERAIMRLAHLALAQYPDRLQGELQLLCRSENVTFRLLADGKRYAMRLHRDNYHQKSEIENELLWLDALRQDMGIVVPEAIPGKDGDRVLTVTDGGGIRRHVVLFDWIEGESPTSSVDPMAFKNLGEMTARLHEHSRKWKRPDNFARIVWNHENMVGNNGHWGDWRDISGISGGDTELVEEVLTQVEKALLDFGQSTDRYGLIHADLRLPNLLIHEGKTQIIDFDDCGMGWFLHDLAAAVSFEEHNPNAPQWIDKWLQGYERVAHIDDDSLTVLPSFLIQRRLQLTAWMASHVETETAKGLQAQWMAHTTRLCRLYLDAKVLPIG